MVKRVVELPPKDGIDHCQCDQGKAGQTAANYQCYRWDPRVLHGLWGRPTDRQTDRQTDGVRHGSQQESVAEQHISLTQHSTALQSKNSPRHFKWT